MVGPNLLPWRNGNVLPCTWRPSHFFMSQRCYRALSWTCKRNDIPTARLNISCSCFIFFGPGPLDDEFLCRLTQHTTPAILLHSAPRLNTEQRSCFSIAVKPQFKVKPKNTTAYEGYPVTLHCVAVGDPQPTIQWDKNNKYITPSNGSRFTVSTVGLSW